MNPHNLKDIYRKVSKELGVHPSVVEFAYRSTFNCAKEIWANMDWEKDYTEEEFNKLKLTYKLGSICRFYPNLRRINSYKEYLKNEAEKNEVNGDNSDVHEDIDNS